MNRIVTVDFLKQHLLPLSVLLLAALAVFTPLLVSPHWGLLSDAGQIVQKCRIFYDPAEAMNDRWACMHGFYRPAFHILDLLTWYVSKENPLGFYIVRLIFFAATVALTYLSCWTLSGSRLLSFVAASFLFVSHPTFEVIYTLDKAEAHIACYFAIVLFTCLTVSAKLSNGSFKLFDITGGAIVILFAVVAAIFTKETGLLAVGLVLLFPASLMVLRRVRPWMFQGSQIDMDTQMKWCAASSLACAVAILTQRVYLLISNLNKGYGKINSDGGFLWSQFCGYLPLIPDFFILLVICLVAAALVLFFHSSSIKQPLNLIFSLDLVAVSLVGTVALMCWNGNLIYIWFPLLPLLLPAAAYFLSVLSANSSAPRRLVVACLILLLVLEIPSCVLEGQAQFQMDAATQEFTKELSRRHTTIKTAGTSFINPESAEIGERLEHFTLNNLVANYRGTPRDDSNMPIKFFNCVYINLPGKSIVDKLGNFFYYDSLSTQPGYKNVPGVDTYAYWLYRYRCGWKRDNLRPGAHILVPTGDLPPKAVSYRCVDLFTSDWKSKLQQLRQVEFVPVFSVMRKVNGLDGKQYKMGWIALKVQSILPVAWQAEPDGWLTKDSTIILSPETASKTLVIETGVGFPKAIKAVWDKASNSIKPTGSDSLRMFRIPIPASASGERLQLHIIADDPTIPKGDPRPLSLNVKRVRIE